MGSYHEDNPDLGAEERIDGLDVISPTWFNLTDGSGNMANRASAAYIEARGKRDTAYGLFQTDSAKTILQSFSMTLLR